MTLYCRWDQMMRARNSVGYRFGVPSTWHTGELAAGFGRVVLAEQQRIEGKRQIFTLGLIGLPGIGKSTFSDHVVAAGGAFKKRAEAMHQQFFGESEGFGKVMRADMHIEMCQDNDVIGLMHMPPYYQLHKIFTRKGLNIIEHADDSGRHDFDALVYMYLNGSGRQVEIRVPPVANEQPHFQRFLSTASSAVLAA